jgi:hypothetical protein
MMIRASDPPMKSRRFNAFFADISELLKSLKANSMTFSSSGRTVGAIRGGLDDSVQHAIPIGESVIPQG